MELSFRPPGGSFEKDQGKWQGTGKGKKKKKRKRKGGVGGNKARRLSPSALGKGELEGSGLRLAKRIFTASELSKLHTLHPCREWE
jgi:hypothetical protein